MMPNKGEKMKTRNEQMLEKILMIRKIKNNYDAFKFPAKDENIIFLEALNDFENELKLEIAKQNNNIDLQIEDNIMPNNKKVTIPIETNKPIFLEYKIDKPYSINQKKEILNNLVTILANKRLDEIKIIYEALKRYAEILEIEQKRQENYAKNYPDIYQLEELNPETNKKIN